MISTEVTSNAPAKSRRAERRRWRSWTTSLVALASVVGVALVPVLGSPPAGASPLGVTTLTGHGGTAAPGLGVPIPEGTAQVNPTYVAFNPANGDEAITSTKAGSVYVYLIAGASENNEYNIETSNSPVTNGSLVAGDVYVVAGTGTAGLVAQPGNLGLGSSSAVATSNPIEPDSVAFDQNGNLVIAGDSAIQVVAKTTGTFYGVAMTAGDLYTVGDVGLSNAPASAINMGGVGFPGNGVAIDANGNIAVGDGSGLIFVNEQTSGSLSLYGQTIAHQSAAVVAGSNKGTTDCVAGATSVAANTQYFQNAEPTFDSSDNLYLGDNEQGGGSDPGGCDWVLPAQSGNVDGMSVTAGDVYKLAGNGGTTVTPSGTSGVQSNVAGTSQLTLDSAGNVVLAVQSGSGFGTSPSIEVLAESNGTFYGTLMTAGNLYTVAGGSGNLLATLSGPTSIFNAGGGNLLFTDGTNTAANLDELGGGPAAGVTAPTVTALSTASGGTGGGTSVTITGTNLNIGTATVAFGTNAATDVVVNSATSITATSPAGTGTVDVRVTDAEGTSPANPPADSFTYNAPATGGAVTLGKSIALIGNYSDKVGGSGWNAHGDTSVTVNQCASQSFSVATCDLANPVSATVGTTGASVGTFKNALIKLAVGTIDSNGDTCGLASSVPCYIVVVGNTGDSTATAALGFTLQSFSVKKTTAVLGNYVDGVKATGIPIGDTVVARECDTSVSVPATVGARCDAITQVSGTASTSGSVVFPLGSGVKMLVGSLYLDADGGLCSFGATCNVAFTDSNNAAVNGNVAGVAFATPVISVKKTTAVLGNYVDNVVASGIPIGDTVLARECDTSVTVPISIPTHCDSATQISGTAATSGKVVFNPLGVTMLVGGAYTDTPASGTCNVGASCNVVVTDSNNQAVTAKLSVAFATPAILVKKTTGALGGYVDLVKATGFPIGDIVDAQECDSVVSLPSTHCDTSTGISGTAGTTGVVLFSPTGVTLSDGGLFSDAASGACPAGGTCDIVVTDTGAAAISLAQAVSFATPAATVKVTANVVDNSVDHVTATLFPIGDSVTALECDSSVTAANVGTNCDNATEITGTVGPTGTVVFPATPPLGVTVVDGGAYTEGGSGTVVPGGSADIVINDTTHTGFFIAVPITMHS